LVTGNLDDGTNTSRKVLIPVDVIITKAYDAFIGNDAISQKPGAAPDR
jgi:hypothetical protein